MKKLQYRIKTCYNTKPLQVGYTVEKVQVKKWWGWMTIKSFPYNILDGSVSVSEPDDRHYMSIAAEELLETLNENLD